MTRVCIKHTTGRVVAAEVIVQNGEELPLIHMVLNPGTIHCIVL